MAVRFDDVHEGMEIPELSREATTRTLAQFAGAVGDWYEVHYDREVAERNGLPDVIVQGYLKKSWLAEAVTSWAGGPHRLRRLSAQYRGVDLPSRPGRPQPFTVRGRVTRRWVENGEKLVELRLEGVNAAGHVTTPGSAVVALD